MAFKNFKLETDADGIVLVTWDTPGRSMNVLDETSVSELEAFAAASVRDCLPCGLAALAQAYDRAGQPDSAPVGTSGKFALRRSPPVMTAFKRPALRCGMVPE